jgi:hypothetical protein
MEQQIIRTVRLYKVPRQKYKSQKIQTASYKSSGGKIYSKNASLVCGSSVFDINY